jgi:anti-anti-sigma factor
MNTEQLQFRVQHHGVVCVLAVSGELDVGTTAHFVKLAENAIMAARHSPKRVVMDLSGLRFIDCGGARALAALIRSAPPRCPVVVRSARPAVRRVLDLMCMDLDLMGPNLDLIGLDVEHVRGSAKAVAASQTGLLVRQTQQARSWSEQTIADSRRTAQLIATTEDRMAATLIRLADRRPDAAGRLAAMSEAAQMQALRMRYQARRPLP